MICFPVNSKVAAKKPLKIICCLSIHRSDDENLTTSNSSINSLRVVFAAGGTGGRVYPAVAIADELLLAYPTAQILFLGTPNSTESAAVPSAGYEFDTVLATPLAHPLISPQNLLLPLHLIKSVVASYKKLIDFKPHIVIGTGGYVSFPICLAAKLINGVKLAIQEQNSVPGFANWVLSHFADMVFVVLNSTVECFPRKKKCLVCGNPVRLTLKQHVPKAVARLHFFPRSGKGEDLEAKVLLILGGSLGANAINIAMLNLYYQMLLENKNLYIIWQTGVKTFDEMDSLINKGRRIRTANLVVNTLSYASMHRFMHSLHLAYAAADLVVSRARAMTCSEILATGKPSILIPSPHDDEGHQLRNASIMADMAGSTVIDEDELDSTTLASAIQEILGDETKMADLSERALRVSKPNASTEIVQHIGTLINLSTRKAKQQ
ncbi:UDP-N-acetylglucosamine--N-acetylmuramyl-(pentapeptide) pyrophosphoryl-undecaprenol N-acetylglucosamine transferase [Cucumis melo var. makuwa]|uniref:UDP-N-acetylglucosamine--N-acetylmuramyl-(Pentapeptide) pyrophosphoryl-undecaprenol N-acetylglucosamine transferase n=1 Tax=Cucumis melo var. makuwa TaxID=1194695 RepID=A0A5D3BIV3_CUCMM|nr:UDP-N-acetylglucosamine--N-acetylmuramyl-(pentapeptide) pyrophosphoryl-undecaprenol N-acetylglucosamine transferase [Cucumis melo var. makuwa]